MTIHEATEAAYKNGYEAGRRDAVKWIPVEERLPKEEHSEYIKKTNYEMFVYPCLVVVKHRLVERSYVDKLFFTGADFINFEGVFYTEDVTHWMPLPEPPKEGE